MYPRMHLRSRRAGGIGLFLGLSLLVGFGRSAYSVDLASPVGQWQSAGSAFQVEIKPCGDALCGVVVGVGPSSESRVAPKIGWQLLSDLRAKSPGHWQGKMHNYMDGKAYDCLVDVDGAERLRVTPFIGIPLLGKLHIWTRMTANAGASS